MWGAWGGGGGLVFWGTRRLPATAEPSDMNTHIAHLSRLPAQQLQLSPPPVPITRPTCMFFPLLRYHCVFDNIEEALGADDDQISVKEFNAFKTVVDTQATAKATDAEATPETSTEEVPAAGARDDPSVSSAVTTTPDACASAVLKVLQSFQQHSAPDNVNVLYDILRVELSSEGKDAKVACRVPHPATTPRHARPDPTHAFVSPF